LPNNNQLKTNNRNGQYSKKIERTIEANQPKCCQIEILVFLGKLFLRGLIFFFQMKEKIIETSKSFLGLSNLALPIMQGFAMGIFSAYRKTKIIGWAFDFYLLAK
jgi:hypothetical protein